MIKVLIMDVDGTLTDGKIYMGENGELMKCFDIKDGCGIHDILPEYDIVPVIITARNSRIVAQRCKELNINFVYQDCRDKIKKIDEIAICFNIEKNANEIYEDMAYIGDDIIDIPAMKMCGIKGCPNNAVESVKAISDFVSSHNGGDGAVRDFIEWLCNQQK